MKETESTKTETKKGVVSLFVIVFSLVKMIQGPKEGKVSNYPLPERYTPKLIQTSKNPFGSDPKTYVVDQVPFFKGIQGKDPLCALHACNNAVGERILTVQVMNEMAFQRLQDVFEKDPLMSVDQQQKKLTEFGYKNPDEFDGGYSLQQIRYALNELGYPTSYASEIHLQPGYRYTIAGYTFINDTKSDQEVYDPETLQKTMPKPGNIAKEEIKRLSSKYGHSIALRDGVFIDSANLGAWNQKIPPYFSPGNVGDILRIYEKNQPPDRLRDHTKIYPTYIYNQEQKDIINHPTHRRIYQDPAFIRVYDPSKKTNDNNNLPSLYGEDLLLPSYLQQLNVMNTKMEKLHTRPILAFLKKTKPLAWIDRRSMKSRYSNPNINPNVEYDLQNRVRPLTKDMKDKRKERKEKRNRDAVLKNQSLLMEEFNQLKSEVEGRKKPASQLDVNEESKWLEPLNKKTRVEIQNNIIDLTEIEEEGSESSRLSPILF